MVLFLYRGTDDMLIWIGLDPCDRLPFETRVLEFEPLF